MLSGTNLELSSARFSDASLRLRGLSKNLSAVTAKGHDMNTETVEATYNATHAARPLPSLLVEVCVYMCQRACAWHCVWLEDERSGRSFHLSLIL